MLCQIPLHLFVDKERTEPLKEFWLVTDRYRCENVGVTMRVGIGQVRLSSHAPTFV